MKTSIRALPGLYDHRVGPEDVLEEGLTVAEMYFWAPKKRAENMAHRDMHGSETRMCRECDNCLCGDPQKRFRCMCAAGKKMLTPYRIRFMRMADLRHAQQGHVYCLNHQTYCVRGPHGPG